MNKKPVYDITGKKYKRLTAIRFLGRFKKRSIWLCRCDCGKYKSTRADYLKNGNTNSCGCLFDDFHQVKPITVDMLLRIKFSQYKKSAKKRNLLFDLTIIEFSSIVKSNCFYCNIPPSPLNGIDRMDNSLGYLRSNIAPCCSECNRAKGFMTFDAFVSLIDRLKNA